MNNNDLTVIIIAGLVAFNVFFVLTIARMTQRSERRVQTLIAMLLPRRPGYRRSGAVLRLPHIDYGECLEDEA